MLNTPFADWPSFTEEEVEAVAAVLRSNRVNYWTGREGRLFEAEFAAWAGCRHAVAMSNGTVALELALRALNIGSGDDVVVTPRSFMASASCVVTVGARPVFADVDPESQNITADSIRAVLTPRTKAVVCVHLAGWPCDMDPIMALAREHGLRVIEDCAQATGATYRGKAVGTIGDIGAWSFCQDKILTTGGEGGMCTTNDTDVYDRLWSLKDHGKTLESMGRHAAGDTFRWVHDRFGTNGRMLEVQAAIGRIQLRRMPEWLRQRRENAGRIHAVCRTHPVVRVPDTPEHSTHAQYKCYVFVRPERLGEGWNRDRILGAIVDRGVPCYSGACPEVYRERAFDGTGYRPAEPLPVAQRLGETSLMFLVHPTLTGANINRACHVLDEVLTSATAGTRAAAI